MKRNVSTTLRRRRRADPMRAYDALPRPLRLWMAQAVLPWSPASCRRIWAKARAEGESPDAILDRLDRAEEMTLSRDRLSLAAVSRAPLDEQQDRSP
ncbi:hypothetical protein OB2597_20991 [Pseudooceanicola batsensis HTCC2597]|uniref:Uncharacterized protein n=1 Tax=Pseudooceanicola batsensis (strain ATCC BAA-863 / DSM 15984 / KCTC 12145 / HTCC2597) TaxID=252305 RepID=A3U1F8_PSEBH|nr:DUF6525 family protein [Pseudooceanicola batsensis]EAQ02141.1 hypothetical protein OB2597_20991 [Pseudooceanicola batsensis HTCC2597]